ncbi:MAG TPA: ATP-binding protein [Chryseosolibacter sp.]|nr:ATP-binding protein [Chryseosolibacter sp.]
MLKQNTSIRSKLMRVMLVTSAAVLLLTFASFLFYEFFSYRQVTEQQMIGISNIIAANSTGSLAFNDEADAQEILQALQGARNIEKAALYDSTGKVFAIYPDMLTKNDFPRKPLRNGVSFTSSGIKIFTSVNQGNKHLGIVYIHRSINDLYERLLLYSVIAGVIMTLAFFLAYLLSRKYQAEIAVPIISLAETTIHVSKQNDYSMRATKMTDDEIGVLTDAFNNMMQHIETQNQEILDARHLAEQQAQELEVKVNERTSELKSQRDFAESILNSSLVMIAVFDKDTRIISFNNRCEEEFGISRTDVLGKRLEDAMPLSKGSTTNKGLFRALRGESVHNPEYQSSVTGMYYESFMLPLRDASNQVYAVLMTAHNITQLVESRERIRHTNLELVRKNSELEQFAYVASHDLQEPLRKIQTFIQLIRRDNDDKAVTSKYLEKVETSAGRMSALIKDVLEYSRLSQVQESFSEVDLNIVLEYVMSDLELMISQTDTIIHCDELPTMMGNRLQLHQLFANLINNSIKFSTRRPEISITTEWLSVSERQVRQELKPGEVYAKIKFADNGIGFEQEYADKIFTIFQRLNTREKFEGTGIGLALCKKIVENHNGHISAASTPGVGTIFSIILPVKTQPGS